MLHELIQFALRHWLLVSAFLVTFALLMIEESKSQVKGLLSPGELTLLINRESPVLLDIRDKTLYKKGHIIGSEQISKDQLQNTQKLMAYQNRTVVVIDKDGSQTKDIIQQLKKANIDQVHALKGGMSAWLSAEMPVVTDEPKNKKRES